MRRGKINNDFFSIERGTEKSEEFQLDALFNIVFSRGGHDILFVHDSSLSNFAHLSGGNDSLIYNFSSENENARKSFFNGGKRDEELLDASDLERLGINADEFDNISGTGSGDLFVVKFDTSEEYQHYLSHVAEKFGLADEAMAQAHIDSFISLHFDEDPSGKINLHDIGINARLRDFENILIVKPEVVIPEPEGATVIITIEKFNGTVMPPPEQEPDETVMITRIYDNGGKISEETVVVASNSMVITTITTYEHILLEDNPGGSKWQTQLFINGSSTAERTIIEEFGIDGIISRESTNADETLTVVETFTYDSLGRLEKVVTLRISDSDGTTEYEEELSYDGTSENLTQIAVSTDTTNDGVFDSIFTQFYTGDTPQFDSRVAVYDFNYDKQNDSQIAETFTWSNGELLEAVTTGVTLDENEQPDSPIFYWDTSFETEGNIGLLGPLTQQLENVLYPSDLLE